MVLVPSLRPSIEETPSPNINLLGIQTPLDFSQITREPVQKTAPFVPIPRRDVSKTLRVPSHLEYPNIGPIDPFNCVRVQDNFFQNSFPKVSSVYPIIGSGGTSNFTGSQRVVAERGHRENPLFRRRLLQPPFSCTQKGWTSASGDRSKLSEQVHFKRAFPDGKSQLPKNVAFERRFYDKYRFKGRLPVSSRPPVIPKVSSVYLGGHLLPVQSPPIRPVFSPQNFYKTNEANRSIPEEKVNTSPYLPGRLPSLSCYKGGSCEKHPSVNNSPSVPRIYNKLQKVIPDSLSGYHLSGFQNRLNVYDAVTPSRKDQQNPRLCSPSTSSSKDNSTKPSKLNWFTRGLSAAILQAPLHFRHLQCDLIWGLQMNRESYDALITLSTSARGELAWWLENTRSTNGSPVHLPPPDMLITTDASMKGWGAVHHSLETNGRWSQQESLQHINYLELKAAFLALKTFLTDRSHVTVSLQIDNTTAIAYINNKGGTHSLQLLTLALELWDWCQARDIFVIASHIPGRDNVSADKESREFRDMSE